VSRDGFGLLWFDDWIEKFFEWMEIDSGRPDFLIKESGDKN
jgi:hypothetical protein